MFEPLEPRESAVDTCARAIRRAIIGGDLKPGARLPPERRLAEQFGVNRVTVRGALARLSDSRLLSVRQGSGYVVQDYRREGGPDLIAGLAELATGKELARIAEDLLFVRRHLARAVLVRIAERRSVETAPVREAVEAFRRAAERGADTDTLARADLGVLAALLDATDSAVLRLCMNPVQQVLAHLPGLASAIYAEPSRNVVGWQGLVAWLAERRPELVDVMVGELERRDAETVARIGKKRR